MLEKVYNLPEDLREVPDDLLSAYFKLKTKKIKEFEHLPDYISEDCIRKDGQCFFRCSKTGKYASIQKMLYEPHANTRYLREEYI